MSRRIERFNSVERIAHWANAALFIALFLTGMVLFFGSIGAALGVGGVAATKLVHRIAAVPFIFVAPLLLIFGTPATTKRFLKEVFTWEKDDFVFLGRFAKEFFGGHADLPPQGKFNAGEKVNSLLAITGSGLLVFSGLIMWFSESFGSNTVMWAYVIHDLAAAVVGGAIIGHSYLGLFHPNNKEALEGMISGTVSEEFAKGHHAKWYAEINAGGGQSASGGGIGKSSSSAIA